MVSGDARWREMLGIMEGTYKVEDIVDGAQVLGAIVRAESGLRNDRGVHVLT